MKRKRLQKEAEKKQEEADIEMERKLQKPVVIKHSDGSFGLKFV